MDGSTVSLMEYVGKTDKKLWYGNEGMLFTYCDRQYPAPQPPPWAPAVSHQVPQDNPLSSSEGCLCTILRYCYDTLFTFTFTLNT